MTVQEVNTLFGKNVRYYRKKKGWTRIELAEKLGIGENSIWGYESGKHIPSLKILISLIAVLEIEIWQLYSIKYENCEVSK